MDRFLAPVFGISLFSLCDSVSNEKTSVAGIFFLPLLESEARKKS